MRQWWVPAIGVCAVTTSAPRIVAGQQLAMTDSARCDSIVTAAQVDSVQSGLFLSIARRDGGTVSTAQWRIIAATLSMAFRPPRPFRLSVFPGPPRTRFLRVPPTKGTLRAPTVTGVYRFFAMRTGDVRNVRVVRASLMVGFDSAALAAIEQTANMHALIPPEDKEAMLLDVRFSTDSEPGARRLFSGVFPRMEVVDAVPKRDNPQAPFPDDARLDSIPSGDIVLRFVVDRFGEPVTGTVEVIRGNSASFLQAALDVLPKQRFTPASVGGCGVAQVVEYAFNFINPDLPPWH